LLSRYDIAADSPAYVIAFDYFFRLCLMPMMPPMPDADI